jgi:hypothetical protein
MTLRKTGTRSRERWALLIGAVAALTLAVATISLAVHDDGFFEVEGNSADSAVAGSGDDWDTLIGTDCGASSLPGSPTVELVKCVPDAAPETAFQGGGSKDDNNIGSWKWANAPGGVAPGKDDIQNAYAALYLDTDGDRHIYFGLDVLPSSGTRQVGFWFLQDPDFGVNPNGTFDGEHLNNDVLVQSNFTQGGQLTNLSVFEWQNGALVLLSSTSPGTNSGCNGALDSVCVAVNTATVNASWRTGIAGGDFFEGGINLDGNPIDFDPEACLANFVAETRSSAPFSARLKDFATGDFDTCAKPTEITTSLSDGTQSGPTITVPIGTSVTDSATLTGDNSADADGTVTYKLYSDDECTNEVDDLTPTVNTVAGGIVPDSDAYVTTAAGTLYWQASYSGDEENDPSDSVCGVEVLTVSKNQPSNSTAQTLIPDDTFTLSGATTGAGGTIDFYLFPPGEDCLESNAVDAAFAELDVAVTGDGDYSTTNAADAAPITATAEGTWKWLVIYSGDDDNEGTTSNCVEEFTIDNDTTPPTP